MQLTGTIQKINEIQNFQSGFQKQDVILLTEEQYPQPILIEFLQKQMSEIDKFKEGDKVTISINIRGREWKSPNDGEVKYFNSITGWKAEVIEVGSAPTPTPADELLKEDEPF